MFLMQALREITEVKMSRGSRPEVFSKKGVLRNFAKFTGKHLCQRLFFNKVAGALAQVFSYKFCEIAKNTFFTKHLRWRLLDVRKLLLAYICQKQPPRGVPRERCSENVQQIYRKTPMPKGDFNKVALQLY